MYSLLTPNSLSCVTLPFSAFNLTTLFRKTIINYINNNNRVVKRLRSCASAADRLDKATDKVCVIVNRYDLVDEAIMPIRPLI